MELLGETLDERIHRLAVRDAERRDQLRQDLDELHHKDGAVDAMAMPPKKVDGWKGVLQKMGETLMNFSIFCQLLGLDDVKDLGNYGRFGL